MSLHVTIRDEETGDVQTVRIPDGEYFILATDPCRVAHVNAHANGTHVLTVKDHAPRPLPDPSSTPSAIDAAHLDRQRAWSRRTFGPGPRTTGVCDHIRKELREIAEEPGDLGEWVDVVILGMDGAWRTGAESQEIIDAIVTKQEINEQREWPDWRTADPDAAIEHVRDGGGGDVVTFTVEIPASPWDEIMPGHGLWQGGSMSPIAAGQFAYVLTLDASASRDLPVPDGTVGFEWHIPDAAVPSEKVLAQWAHLLRDLTFRARRKVLVRCQAGLNRSGLLVASTLVVAGFDPSEAIALIRRRRSPHALCNPRFEQWIREDSVAVLRRAP